MTYTIIGGDGKEYGPISANDVRQWVAEGRLNAQSLCKAESDAEFRALDKFPEFADVFANKVPPPLSALGGGTSGGDSAREQALQKIKAPALALRIVAVINLILATWSLFQMLFFPTDMRELNSELQTLNNPQLTEFVQKIAHISNGPIGIANILLGAVMSVLIFMGATKMQSLRSYEFSLTAAILSVIPCLTPCCGWLIGLIFGIWALRLLANPEIKSQFN